MRLPTLVVIAAAGVGGLACQRPALSIGAGQTSSGQVMTVAAAAFGDDWVQIMAQSDDCSEFITYRNFPSWQFDSVQTGFGGAIGSGVLSSTGELCGRGSGEGWIHVGECGAALTVEASTSEEIKGTLRFEKSTGGTLMLEFRAARATLTDSPRGERLTLCDGPAEGPGAGVCCNWSQDEACAQRIFQASCRN